MKFEILKSIFFKEINALVIYKSKAISTYYYYDYDGDNDDTYTKLLPV